MNINKCTKKNKIRLDEFLVNKGYFETKSQAQGNILAGKVKINDKVITKAGFQIKEDFDENIEIKSMPYVSRGGFKLEGALKKFDIDVRNRTCIDAGASTGGFTDVLLQNKAKFVYAVDVGHNQIAWKFRNHPQVKNIEKINIKNCTISDIYGENEINATLCVMDLSFISLTKVLENLKSLLNKDNYEMIALIKPQFEAGKEEVSRHNGVIKDKDIHKRVIEEVLEYACSKGLYPVKLAYSPIKGPKGNIEYLVHLSNNKCDLNIENIQEIVDKAHQQL